jgi:hypothetical protein
MRPTTRHLYAVASFFAWLTPACTASVSEPSGAVVIETGELEFFQRMDWGRATPGVDDSTWSTASDQGYLVTVRDGFLSTFSVQLVACRPAADAGTSDVARSWLDRLLPRALAGHGADSINPAAFYGPVVHPLRASVSGLGSARFDPHRLCSSHVVLARAREDSAGLPNDQMVDVTLAMNLEVVGPDGFRFSGPVELAGGHGYLRDLLGTGGEVSAPAAAVTVVRDLGAFFDGVDFAAMSSIERDRALLAAISAATRVDVVAGNWSAQDLNREVAP